MAAGKLTTAALMRRQSFEVFGKVQGVFFRKHTCKTARALGLGGFVQNTTRGTVVGEAEGPAAALEQLRDWLSTKGSPKSRIDKAEFGEEVTVASERKYKAEFAIVRGR